MRPVVEANWLGVPKTDAQDIIASAALRRVAAVAALQVVGSRATNYRAGTITGSADKAEIAGANEDKVFDGPAFKSKLVV